MRNVRQLLFLPTILLFVVGFSACGILSPIRTAETLEQRVYAAYGTFVIMEERADELTTEGSGLEETVQLRIIRAVESAQPAIDTMRDAHRSYETARAEFEAQAETLPAFQVVVNNLENWVSEAEGLVANLVASMQGVRP